MNNNDTMKTGQIGDICSNNNRDKKYNCNNICLTCSPKPDSQPTKQMQNKQIYLPELDRIKSKDSLISKGSLDSFDQFTYEATKFDINFKIKSNEEKMDLLNNVQVSSAAFTKSSRSVRSMRSNHSLKLCSQTSISSTGFIIKNQDPDLKSLRSLFSLVSLSLVDTTIKKNRKRPNQRKQSRSTSKSDDSRQLHPSISPIHGFSQFCYYNTPVYHSSTDTSSLNGIIDDTHFVKLLNSPFSLEIQADLITKCCGLMDSYVDEEVLGILLLVQLNTSSLAILPVHYRSNTLGVVTAFNTLAQVELHPIIGTNQQEQTISEMATYCRQSLLIRLTLFSTKLANYLQLRNFPYKIISPERVVHLTNFLHSQLPNSHIEETSSNSSTISNWIYS